jgi:MFS family permease
MKRLHIFLVASFLSAIGDFALVFSLPNGLGKETGKIEFAVVAWLVPAIAVFGSSFVGNFIRNRNSDRRDYAFLLCGIALLELIICFLINLSRDQTYTLVLATLFVLLYAFAKEGVGRVLYHITVYRYFASNEEFNRVSGFKAAGDVLGGLVGIVLASQLIATNEWRFALVLDAMTFLVLGCTILFAGRDIPHPISEAASDSNDTPPIRDDILHGMKWVLIAVPLLHAINALYANYLPLIGERLGLIAVSSSVLLIAALRAPGLVAGLLFGRIANVIPVSALIRAFPWVHLSISIIFLLMPSVFTMAAAMLIGGLGVGLFMPACGSAIKDLPRKQMVRFNTFVMRWLGVFQFLACVTSIWLYRGGGVPNLQAILAMAIFCLGALALWPLHRGAFAPGASRGSDPGKSLPVKGVVAPALPTVVKELT